LPNLEAAVVVYGSCVADGADVRSIQVEVQGGSVPGDGGKVEGSVFEGTADVAAVLPASVAMVYAELAVVWVVGICEACFVTDFSLCQRAYD
jgi:hypothetical protein